MSHVLATTLVVMTLLPCAAFAQSAGQGPRMDPLPRMTIDQALATEKGPLARRVLQWVKVMEGIVKEGKKPGFSEANWARLGENVDLKVFRRVGNFGEVMGWKEYTPMLTQWARSSYWTGRIRRVREVGNLVYLEAEERSSNKGEFGEDGGYNVLNSNSVYEFDANGKLIGLWVYDQSPR